ncbi:MAG TPA: hypothetical protein VJL54_02120 [Nitrososphaera sp.]|nr:hypothetical protein [Nitrososphaera sp.]
MDLADLAGSEAIVDLKREYVRSREGRAFLSEVIPCVSSERLPIDDSTLRALHSFAVSNPVYVKSYVRQISGLQCTVYEADINDYWLSSKKHDSSYQPFYPTWIISAYALARATKSLGFKELVDIGSGDGRLAYCGKLAGMDSFGIEIDSALVDVQTKISRDTGVKFAAIEADATRFEYSQLGLSRPFFFISGLPEMGEMLARSVMAGILSDSDLRGNSGFGLMGSHVMKRYSRDHTGWGWGRIISDFSLAVKGVATLPTYWTADELHDTAYVYAISQAQQSH